MGCVASWRVLRWCRVRVHPTHGDQIWIDALLLGHEDLNADAGVVEHEHHVIAGWKFFDELERGGEAGGIEADAGEPVVQDVKTDRGPDGFDAVPGFDYEEVAKLVGIESLTAEVIDALLHQLPDRWVADLVNV